MRRGFSILELLVSLVLFEVGILATVGMIFLAQQNFRRAELTLRGVLETRWVADSLVGTGTSGGGSVSRPWGTISWAPSRDPVPGVLVSALSAGDGDTLAWTFAPERSVLPDPFWLDSNTVWRVK